jgi:hypothetical protein
MLLFLLSCLTTFIYSEVLLPYCILSYTKYVLAACILLRNMVDHIYVHCEKSQVALPEKFEFGI